MKNTKRFIGQQVVVEEVPGSGSWIVGRKDPLGRIADSSETIELYVGQLTKSPDRDPEAHDEALRDFARCRAADHGYLLTWLAEEVDNVIQYFCPKSVQSEDIKTLAHQIALCQAWLDYLQGNSDYQVGQMAAPNLLLLWRRYYYALAALNEVEPDEPAWAVLDLVSLRVWHSWRPIMKNEYRRALRNWSRILLDPDNQWFISDVLGLESKLNAPQRWEAEANNIIWRTNDKLYRFFQKEETGHRFLDRLARQWFLPRYDLPAVTRLCLVLLSPGGSKTRWPPGWHWLYNPHYYQPWLTVGISTLLLLLALGFRSFSPVLTTALVACAALCALGVLCCALYAAVQPTPGRIALYPFSPRLAAGTIVGLLALSGLGDQLSDFALNAFGSDQHPYTIGASLLVLGILLGAAWLYTFTDALSRLGDRHLACQRTWLVFLFGWTQAMLFAAAVSWIGAGRLFALHADKQPPPLRSFLFLGGTIVFDYIIAAGTLAFVVGVFTQILWEDRAVTEPL